MKKPLVEHCDRLHIRDVKAAIPQNAVEVTLEVGAQTICVVGKITNLGNGYRYFFVCSRCERLYETLYRADLGWFKCRNCIGLVYCSTRKKQVELGQYEYGQRINHQGDSRLQA